MQIHSRCLGDMRRQQNRQALPQTTIRTRSLVTKNGMTLQNIAPHSKSTMRFAHRLVLRSPSNKLSRPMYRCLEAWPSFPTTSYPV